MGVNGRSAWELGTWLLQQSRARLFWRYGVRFLLTLCRLGSFLSQRSTYGWRCVERAVVIEASHRLVNQLRCHVVCEAHNADGLDVVALMARDGAFEVGARELHRTAGKDALSS